MTVQSANESSFLTEQIQRQVVSLKSSEVYLSFEIKLYVGVYGEHMKKYFRNTQKS